MALSRRSFLQSTVKSVILLGMGNALPAFMPAGFILPARKDIRLRFALASDGHYGEPKSDYEARHRQMADWLNAEAKDRGLDFVVVNGDIFHNDPVFLPQAKTAWDRLEMPYYVSHGNHDMTAESHWKEVWGMPFDHGFEKKDAGFIILNTADIKGVYTGPDLERTKVLLEQYSSHKHLFVFMHITPMKWTKYGIDRPDIVDLFSRQPNLKAVFHGHDHDEDGMREKDGKYYFWDAHVAGTWGTDYKGYRVVEVLKNGSVLTYQADPSAAKQVNNNRIA
ncbi:metallophosphoesterase family protein [Chitinophaga japonensis]|uniref:Calcineurin-like phosphoesterase family protein n=1 Tax=Chitinophaga japonensis TaxID=104662 RepID=A0A562T8R2_CHIJA|nr:metallophosphoesterase [Chitinophaga japonensis]TWI89316.1 calcineurin-like phosphoesterase family protein [Chitinophaga japonensis]